MYNIDQLNLPHCGWLGSVLADEPPGPGAARHTRPAPPDHGPPALHRRAAALFQHHLPPAVRKVHHQPAQSPGRRRTAGPVSGHDQVPVSARQAGGPTSPDGDAAQDLPPVCGGTVGEGFSGNSSLDPPPLSQPPLSPSTPFQQEMTQSCGTPLPPPPPAPSNPSPTPSPPSSKR